MASDERDRRFDKALARHLRSTEPAHDSAGLPGIPTPLGGDCPDPETLAAYHERSLFSEEMNSLKEHIVGCANCQSVLAQLEATDEILLQALQVQTEQQVIAAKESMPVAATSAAASRKSRRVILLRGARWQWLAPAGALAAGLLVWIALHENRPFDLPRVNEVQVTKNQQLPSAAPPASRSQQEIATAAKTAPVRPSSKTDEFAAAGAHAGTTADALKSNEKQEYLAKAAPTQPLAGKETRLRKDAGNRSTDDLRRAEEQLDRDAKAGAGVAGGSAENQLQTQAANIQLQNQSNANAPKTVGPAALGQMETKKMKTASAAPAALPPPPPSPTDVGGLVSSYDNSTALEVNGQFSNPRLITRPGSNFFWRAGRHGVIEYSKDGGSSWLRQASGVQSDLLAGSAPTDQVCWIVGRAGAILLTMDGGAHWNIIKSPFTEDLGGVRASDALHATIWNAHATKSFQTSDSGQTWTPVPGP